MSRADKEEKTQVICPECGNQLGTWGVNYFNHCGKRHSVPDNLVADTKSEETILSEEDLEEGESLVRCAECGEFLITTETDMFTHCEKEQSVKDGLADFEDLNGGDEDEKKNKGSEGEMASPPKTRTVLPKRKASFKKGKGETDGKTSKTGEEEEKPDESEDATPEEGTPDKEPETWVCVDCGCYYTDNGYSDAKCPECGCEYAEPYEEE